MTTVAFPIALAKRRVHSLMGLWLVLFLCEHLLTNSQAALWIGEDGHGFVRMVNAMHNLPYLPVIEIFLLGVPILFHAILGIRYAWISRCNASKTDGSKPSLNYGRNRAFSWQRITSWMLLIGLLVHVTEFRFLRNPERVISHGGKTAYVVNLSDDPGLDSLCKRLDVTLVRSESGKIAAKSQTFGTATLLAVRDTFKNPVYQVGYMLFVGAACFHAFNGFWTFFLSWGIIVRRAAQKSFLVLTVGLMAIVLFLGLAAIFGTWVNLRN